VGSFCRYTILDCFSFDYNQSILSSCLYAEWPEHIKLAWAILHTELLLLADPHHLRFAQPRALGLKVSDEFTVPLCRGHHRQLHQVGNEVVWWESFNINALEIAKGLWEQNHLSVFD